MTEIGNLIHLKGNFVLKEFPSLLFLHLFNHSFDTSSDTFYGTDNVHNHINGTVGIVCVSCQWKCRV